MIQISDIPTKTQAIQFSKTGGPEVLELVDVETPTAKPDELLVKIEWGGVNFSEPIDTTFEIP